MIHVFWTIVSAEQGYAHLWRKRLDEQVAQELFGPALLSPVHQYLSTRPGPTCTLYCSPVPTSIEPSAFGCSLMEVGRYRAVRLSFHISNVSGDATSALSDITGGSVPRARVRRVSSGANCLHLLQFALVVLSLSIDETNVSGKEEASPALKSVLKQRCDSLFWDMINRRCLVSCFL